MGASLPALALDGDAAPPVDDDTGKPTEQPTNPPAKSGGSQVLIQAPPWLYNAKTRYAHTLPEVDGPIITVTKKTTVVELDAQPTIIDNNQRELTDRLPGLVLAEQQNPTQLNLSYRGLGNPQESEYVLLMQDAIPIELDWIGFPTVYYLPVPQTLASVQMIRAGSGLLYGPEPQPVINFVSRAPDPTRTLGGSTEQVGGDHGLFSSFNSVSGTSGDFGYLADYAHRQSDGQRDNGAYTLDSGDLRIGWRIDPRQKLSLDVHLYSLESGLAGLMSHDQFVTDNQQTTTPADRLWTNRYMGVLSYENAFTDKTLFSQRLWTGFQDLVTRSDGATPTSATMSDQTFHYFGLDGRLLQRWGKGNALTVGYTWYDSHSPYNEFLNPNPYAPRDDRSGVPFYRSDRSTHYGAVFAENVFRFAHRIHLVTSARYEIEELGTQEFVALLHPTNLVDRTYRKSVPLFGIGLGNDFGHGNETYLNVSQGFRPLRYLDIGSPFGKFSGTNNPDPTRYVTYEAGVHGWPKEGLYYDVSLFQVNARDRIESQALSQNETIDVNTGSTRSRGAELEASYDLLRLWPDTTADRHLEVFANASFLNARFTGSSILGQVGKTPAYAPDSVVKAGITLRRDHVYKASLVMVSVASQYFQDNNAAAAGTPAHIPSYTVADFSADYVIGGHLRLLGGVANFFDRRYYSRVFLFGGQLEPAERRAFHLGAAYDF